MSDFEFSWLSALVSSKTPPYIDLNHSFPVASGQGINASFKGAIYEQSNWY
jgi:hypothetical protein